jgi:hypothetical protein
MPISERVAVAMLRGRCARQVPDDGRHRPGPQGHERLPGFPHFRIGGHRGELALPEGDPVLGQLLGVVQFVRRTGTRLGGAEPGPVLACGVVFAGLVFEVVQTGLHHHATFFLLAGRTIGATGRR